MRGADRVGAVGAALCVALHHFVVGVEPLDGKPASHLKLRAVIQPRRYQLRDLWIDIQTYATRQLVSDGNFTNGPWPCAPWTVRFAQIDGATYIATERAGRNRTQDGISTGVPRASGGTGRRAGFRFQWGNPSEFESLLAHAGPKAICRQRAEVAQW